MIQRELVTLKPSVTRCGTHWSVEWNRCGDFFPVGLCKPTWAECVAIGVRVFVQGKTAQVEPDSYIATHGRHNSVIPAEHSVSDRQDERKG
jgi:hypothetical protein